MNGLAGTFISFEGIEGAGKTTQARALEAWLRARHRPVVAVREPGGTLFSERMREVLLGWTGPPIDGWAEMCLYAAARAQLVREVVRPALRDGAVVLADRFADASVAYQGGGRGLGARRVRSLNQWVTDGTLPVLTFLLDLDPAEGMRRIRLGRGPATLDRLESEPLAFHRRVRGAYLRIARAEPKRVRVLDATRTPEELEGEIRAAVDARL